jgi:hypothetical protein
MRPPCSAELDRDDARPYFVWDQTFGASSRSPTWSCASRRWSAASGADAHSGVGSWIIGAPMASSSILTELQRDVLAGFFRVADGFFLSEGTALAEYYLHHRSSVDLDLFTTSADALPHGRRFLEAACTDAGARMEPVREYPGYQEHRTVRGGEVLKIDLVHDTAIQLLVDKPRFGGIVVDSIEDLAANKICTLLGRAEIRDLVDLYFLDREGYRVPERLGDAQRKEGGVEAATLAWILGEIRLREIPTFLLKPLTPQDLQAFVDRLATELARQSFPTRST